MPRPKAPKITLEEAKRLETASVAALAVLHETQRYEAVAHMNWRGSVVARQDAEKAYADAIRRFKLAEAKLPPPEAKRAAWAELHDSLRAETPETLGLIEPTVYADGEPVEV